MFNILIIKANRGTKTNLLLQADNIKKNLLAPLTRK